MRPVSLMRLKKLNHPNDVLKHYDAKDLIIEQKYDGFKVLAIRQTDSVHLYTRRGIDFTKNIPSLAEKLKKIIPRNSTVLGELVVVKNGKQSLSAIQSVVNSHPIHAQEVLKECAGCILIYIVYDILEYKGQSLTFGPTLLQRRKILKKIIPDSPLIKLSPIFPFSYVKKVIKKSLSMGGEGIVIKPKNSFYIFNDLSAHEPTGEWFKYKPSSTEDVILNSYFYRHKEKKAIFPAYQYKKMPNGHYELFEVGKLSGMDRATEMGLMHKIDQKHILVVEVTYQEKFPTGKIRSMGWVRDRTKEKSPKDVIWRK